MLWCGPSDDDALFGDLGLLGGPFHMPDHLKSLTAGAEGVTQRTKVPE